MKIHNGNNIDILKTYPDNYFDSIVTDPPYGIEFLAKEWDSNTGAVESWAECYRVLKPGGYILAFSAARTYHNLATNIEGVGFEIRDQIMWLYASGFPKAQDMGKAIQKRQGVEKSKPSKGMNAYPEDVKNGGNRGVNPGNITAEDYPDKKDEIIPTSPEAKQWSGWKTALKPAHEPIVIARKPFKGSCIDNVLTHGVGALNIDATRVNWEDGEQEKEQKWREKYTKTCVGAPTFQGTDIQQQTKGGQTIDAPPGRYPTNVIGEVTDYQKFFYCPKVNRAERHIGFEAPEPEPFNNPDEMKKHPLWDPSIGTNSHRLMQKIREHQKNNPHDHIPSTKGGFLGTDGEWNPEHWHSKKGGRNKPNLDHIPTNPNGMLQDRYESSMQVGMYQDAKQNIGNNHPTVKPVALMKYLVKLVTPAGGKVLDPFCGSGSTGMAAVELDYDFTGCELDPAYVNIATQRITAWKNKTDLNNNPLPEQWFTQGE